MFYGLKKSVVLDNNTLDVMSQDGHRFLDFSSEQGIAYRKYFRNNKYMKITNKF